MCLAAGSLLVLAPMRVPPDGCGDLASGRLCIEGPIGAAGTFTTRYIRNDGRHETRVRLGYQRRDARLTAFADWFGTSRTLHGAAQLSGSLTTAPDECIRGIMIDAKGKAYATQWTCAR